MIHTLHRMAQGCCACHVIHAGDERISSTLSPPFPSTSSSSHSSSIFCTSSTTLRAVATLRTSPESRWTLLTMPTSSHHDLLNPGCLCVNTRNSMTSSMNCDCAAPNLTALSGLSTPVRCSEEWELGVPSHLLSTIFLSALCPGNLDTTDGCLV